MENAANIKPNDEVHNEAFVKISGKIASEWCELFPDVGAGDSKKDTLSTEDVVNRFATMIKYCNDNLPYLDIYDGNYPEELLTLYFYLESAKQQIYEGIKKLEDGEKLAKRVRIKVAKDIIAENKYSSDDEVKVGVNLGADVTVSQK